jgi:hypothetical protein
VDYGGGIRLATGDVFTQIYTTSGTWVSFQPAAATEYIITCASAETTALTAQFDGVTTAIVMATNPSYASPHHNENMKFFINNSVYLRTYGNSGSGAMGVQIK